MKVKKEKSYQVAIPHSLYFQFEEEFAEDNVRCIPMVVRFKLDAVCIKLKLAEWSRLHVKERKKLAILPCSTPDEIRAYRNYLFNLVLARTGNEPAELAPDPFPAWSNHYKVDDSLQAKAREHNWYISLGQWNGLSNLQRFALLKLYRPGHENKNFPKAMREFNLV